MTYTSDANAYYEDVHRQQRAQWQPRSAEYYNFTNDEGQLNAGLIVLLDGQGRAEQAELRFYSTLEGQARNAILRQAQTLLAERYIGLDRTTPLYLVEGAVTQAPVEVLHTMVPTPPGENSYQLWPVLLGIAGIVALLLLFGIFSMWLRGDQQVAEATPTVAPAAASTTGEALPAAAAARGDSAALAAGQTNNLPPSAMANDALDVGTRARIRPQLQSFVRTLPGPDQGEPVGYLQNGAEVTIVGGPVWLPGESDTIVWWLVELPEGTQGWTPANTSTLTLLDPVQ